MLNRKTEYWVWCRSPHGGSFLEFAATLEQKDKIKARLEAKGLTVRVNSYHRIN